MIVVNNEVIMMCMVGDLLCWNVEKLVVLMNFDSVMSVIVFLFMLLKNVISCGMVVILVSCVGGILSIIFIIRLVMISGYWLVCWIMINVVVMVMVMLVVVIRFLCIVVLGLVSFINL